MPDDERPLNEQAAPRVLASPSEMSREGSEEMVWWKPSWRDSARYVGYRWIFLTPALVVIALFVLVYFHRGFRNLFLYLGVKLLLLVIGAVASLSAYVIRRAARARTEPFCIHCGYNLTGLPDNYRCPECGRPYAWRLIDEYRRDPESFIERYEAGGRLPDAATPFESGALRRPRRRDGT